MKQTSTVAWIVAIVAALAVVALLVWGDREPGIDDRDTDPEDVQTTAVISPSPSAIYELRFDGV